MAFDDRLLILSAIRNLYAKQLQTPYGCTFRNDFMRLTYVRE